MKKAVTIALLLLYFLFDISCKTARVVPMAHAIKNKTDIALKSVLTEPADTESGATIIFKQPAINHQPSPAEEYL